MMSLLQFPKDLLEELNERIDGFGISGNHVIWENIALGYPVSDGVILQKNDKVIKYV